MVDVFASSTPGAGVLSRHNCLRLRCRLRGLLQSRTDLFIQTCVATGHFTTALPILAVPITSVDTSVSDLHYNDNLVYHYSGGMALAALKRWREAEEFFELCVSAPAQVPAAIQLEAYKKLVLVQLIQYGEVRPTHVSQFFQHLTYAIDDLRSKIYPSSAVTASQRHPLRRLHQDVSRADQYAPSAHYQGAGAVCAGRARDPRSARTCN